jgi:5-methyltetrahydropteroyltriglutamate--homocysteine methyltransferase
MQNAKSTILGYPRIGANRELKRAQESYWRGDSTISDLMTTAKDLRKLNLSNYKKLGISNVPVGDFAYYDHMLDMISLLGVIPKEYDDVKPDGKEDKYNLAKYYALARGYQKNGLDLKTGEMIKWFDTNYHYIVPQFNNDTKFSISCDKIFDECSEAIDMGLNARAVLMAPVSFLLLSKGFKNPLSLLPNLLKTYQEIINKLVSIGVKEIQFDEPYLAMDLTSKDKEAIKTTYKTLNGAKFFLASYFSNIDYNFAYSLDVDTIHIDTTRCCNDEFISSLNLLPKDKKISVGIVNGRNIWANDLNKSLNLLKKVSDKITNERMLVSSSCSLLHSPVSLVGEDKIDKRLFKHLAFANEKLSEIVVLTKGVNNGTNSIKNEIEQNSKNIQEYKTSDFINNNEVQKRCDNATTKDSTRDSKFPIRKEKQTKALNLKPFPTTTIGSFPQTNEVRKTRLDYKKGIINQEAYDAFIAKETISCIREQEKLDIDVLVHGEFERNDMVEYFGENLNGMAFSSNGWVQSYGSRCVKPPMIYGDISRARDITVKWSKFAQEQTKKPMKAMLTGPVTILKWSFPRQDVSLEYSCKQIAFALRDEVVALESAGLKIIQIDEPAIREVLPLKKAQWHECLNWAVESFRISASGVRDETQIHTHMCYSDFNSMIKEVIDMDADVITIEASKSKMDILQVFKDNNYPNEIGLGVYDIHTPRIPNKDEMVAILNQARNYFKDWQIWVNPDCGLKTRKWPETKEALDLMVQASKEIRKNL